jgi:hypothetical protein
MVIPRMQLMLGYYNSCLAESLFAINGTLNAIDISVTHWGIQCRFHAMPPPIDARDEHELSLNNTPLNTGIGLTCPTRTRVI